MRLKGFEFEDQPWFPEKIREGMTSYLRFLFQSLNLYQPVLPLLKEATEHCRTNHILDLCSGSGGSIEKIRNDMMKYYSMDIKFTLTDRYPNPLVYQYISDRSQRGITYYEFPVDATRVPLGLEGFRTLFSSFHHFDRHQAKAVLKDAVNSNHGIGVFDGGNKSFIMILLIIFMHPLVLWLFTPFFKPFRWSRIFYTYLFPAIPFCSVWDGIFSILRLYEPSDLIAIAKEADSQNYSWSAGKVKNSYGLSIAYLIGLPPKKDPGLQQNTSF